MVYYLLTGLLLSFCAPSWSFTPASIYVKDLTRSSTSSTLVWVSNKVGQQPPLGAVTIAGEGGEGGEVWCRAEKHGQYAAGAVREGVCHFPFLTTAHTSKDFDILVSINGSAHLALKPWDKFTPLPSGGVSTPQMILAVQKDEDTGVLIPGFVDHKNRQPFFMKADGEVIRSDSATLITELEPKEYELFTIVQSEKSIKRTYDDDVKAELYLENSSPREHIVKTLEDFTVVREQYWGNVKGTVRGINFTTPDQINNLPNPMIWGTYNQLKIPHEQEISYRLPPGSAVKGKLIAKMRTLEVAYSASLTAMYEDNSQRTRPITAFHKDVRMAELRVDFEQPISLANSQTIKEIQETSTILRHSTTTTTTTTTTPSPSDQPPSSLQVGSGDSMSRQSVTLSLIPLLLLFR